VVGSLVGREVVGGSVSPAFVGGGVLKFPTNNSLFGDDAVRPVNAPVVAALSSAASTPSGVAVKSLEYISATAPATCGAAIDVPEYVAVAVSLDATELRMPEPGAKMSTQLP